MLWDSHPLAIGATPQQVWIDGIAQLSAPHLLTKPASLQTVPKTPNFDKEREETLEYDGLPPLAPEPSRAHTVIFTNISSIYLRDGLSVRSAFSGNPSSTSASARRGVVVIQDGHLICASPQPCAAHMRPDAEYIDLAGGSISPGLVSAGSALGTQEIDQEMSTQDGIVFDPLSGGVPELVGGAGALIRASDGLQFGTRDAL